ncbi:MAG: hypothetical protein H6707_21255 [Deltaproteobacteria bacterium]|nr:hypothetical protein [Deltaproteobacteria bacterium]
MICKSCGDEVDRLVRVRVGRKTHKLCEECAELKREELEIADDAEAAMREMMEYKGR